MCKEELKFSSLDFVLSLKLNLEISQAKST